MAGKDNGVNPETRAELAEFKEYTNRTITDLIKEGFKEIQERMTELFNKDIDHIKETQERHSDHHEKHYTEISKIKDMLIEHRVAESTKDKIDEVQDRKKELSNGVIITICTVLGLLLTTISVVVTIIIMK